jgi:hypothetical protein
VLELLLTDVALCALLVMVAGGIMLVRRRRRNRAAMLAAEPPGTAAELPDDGTAGRETAVVPGFGDDPAEPDLNGARPGPNGRRAQRDGRRPKPQANGVTAHAPDPDRPDAPRAAPNGQSATGAATASDRIGSYYDEADRAMADYLAAMGWTGEPETRRTG